MKLCIPVEADRGMQSPVFGHFGSAPVFAVHDTETGDTTFTENENEHHAHGGCQPLAALDDRAVDAIVVGGIGARAVMRLNAQGIKVYRAVPGTLADAVDAWKAGRLAEIAVDEACSHHGGCDH